MSDRTKLLKKAVMTGVGATSSAERLKDALKDAMQDLVKVGQELIDDLEEKGKVKTESAESLIKGFKDEAVKRTGEIEKQVSKTMRKAAKEFGFVTMEHYDQLLERLAVLEHHAGVTKPEHIEDADQHHDDGNNDGHSEEHNGEKKKKSKKAEA